MPRLALWALWLVTAGSAWAVEWQVVPLPATQPPSATQAEFLRALQGPAEPAKEAPTEDTAVIAGVRTRSLRAPSVVERVALAVGAEAARAALAQESAAPLLLALLSRQELDALPVARPQGGRLAVLLRDTSPADQLTLVDAVLPGRRRIGVLVAPGSDALLRELQRAADADGRGWSLQVAQASDPQALGAALRDVLPRSDALLVLPDAIGASQAATLAVLRAAAAAGVPVIGTSEGIVRSGALAANVASPTQLARQAQGLGERLLARTSPAAPSVEWAATAQVRVNPPVARSLDLRLPGEQELTQRLAATGKGP